MKLQRPFPHSAALAPIFAVAAASVFSGEASAACAPAAADNATVTCTDTTTNYNANNVQNFSLTVTSGATVLGTNGNDAIRITNNNAAPNTLTNFGLIDGPVTMQSFAGNDAFINFGTLRVTDPTVPLQTNYSIAGNFEQKAGGSLALRFDSNFFNDDVLALAGTLTLNGKLILVPQAGLYGGSFTNTYLSTGGFGTVTGTFSSVVVASPFFTVTPIYNATSVDVTLTPIAFNAVPGLTPNQQAVANALAGSYSINATGAAATFYGNLYAASSVAVFDQLSGEGISGAQNAAFTAGSLFNNAMQSQGMFAPDISGLSMVVPAAPYAETRKPSGSEAFAALKAPAAAQPGRFRIWTAGFGATQSLNGEADTGSFRQSVRSAGGVLGVDWLSAPDLRLGLAAGGSESTFSVGSLSTSGRLTGGHIGAYAMKTWGAYYAAASLSYARLDNSTTRTIAGVGPTESASGRFDSDQLSGRFELGWKQAYGRINVTPFVAIEPAALWQRGFTETGTNVLGLDVASHTATSLPTFVGAQVDGRYLTSDGAVFAPYSRVSWVHEFEPDRRVTAAFVAIPGAGFTVDGARAARDAARLDTGARLTFRGGPALFANFAGEWSDRTQSYTATGGFRAAW
jgi:uncharacterized protein with beta-barrel porin domain